MESVTISPKFQVVIPKRVRKSMRLKPGQRMQVVEFGSRIEFVPIGKMSRLRGIAKGIDTTLVREEDRV
jgi:AbrB family looped-hinge helix DNA binding protein